MTGQIPSELGQMTALTFIRADWNDFSGTLPMARGEITALKQLNVKATLSKWHHPDGACQQSEFEHSHLGYHVIINPN